MIYQIYVVIAAILDTRDTSYFTIHGQSLHLIRHDVHSVFCHWWRPFCPWCGISHILQMPDVHLRTCCVECNIVFYCTAIYREYIVSDNQENLVICLCYEFRPENSDIYLFRLYLFMAYYHIAEACLQIQGSRWNIISMMTMQYSEGISFVHICLIFMEWMLFHTREFGLRIAYTALPVDN